MICIALVVCTSLMTALTLSRAGGVDVPILMYHSLLKDKARHNAYVIAPDEFERDLIFLTENGYTTVFISELINYVQTGAELPEKPVVISFDDGNYNSYSYAFELLKKYNCKMVLSPIASSVQKYTDEPDISPTYGYCNWDNLKEMQDSGLVKIANHSFDMHKTSGRNGVKRKNGESYGDYKSAVGADIAKAQSLIYNNLGVTPQCFTYPFGAYCEESEHLIREMGFACSLSCTEKISTITAGDFDSLYCLGRFLRDNTHSAQTLLSNKI